MQVPDLVVQQGYKLCPEVDLLGGRAGHQNTTQGQGTVEGPGIKNCKETRQRTRDMSKTPPCRIPGFSWKPKVGAPHGPYKLPDN